MESAGLRTILERHPLANVSVLGFIDNYPVTKWFSRGESVIVLGESDHLWAYLACRNEEDLRRLMCVLDPQVKHFASVESWMIPILIEFGQPEWYLKTHRYVFPDSASVPAVTYSVVPLEISDADYIFRHSEYQAFTSVEYIKDRLERGLSAGVLQDGVLAAWGLTHDDDALGFLHVLPEFRRRGLGQAVVASLIWRKRELGKPVYVNIEPDNTRSLKLVEKMGFVFDREISWVKLL